jgi:hypothetical protein
MPKQWPEYMGTYKGIITETGFTQPKEGQVPPFVVSVQLTEYWDAKEGEWFDASDNDYNVRAYLYLYGREGGVEGANIVETLNHGQVCKVFGWDGCGLTYLCTTDFIGKEVQVRISASTYAKAKTPVQVDWIDVADADPTNSLNTMDVEEVKAMELKFAYLWKGKKTTTKAASAKKAPKKEAEPKEEDAPPETDASPTKEDRKAALLAKSKKIKAAAAKEAKEAKKESSPPPPSEKPEPKAQVDDDEVVIPDDYSKKMAWSDIVEAKDPDCDDDILKSVWAAAIADIAEGGDEDNLDNTGWWAVKEQVLSEVGVF